MRFYQQQVYLRYKIAYFESKNNELILIDEYLQLKINSNREIYFKLLNDSSYQILTDKKVPLGFNVEEKKAVLMQINEKILREHGNEIDAKVNGDDESSQNKDRR